jgi:hypothetical protein
MRNVGALSKEMLVEMQKLRPNRRDGSELQAALTKIPSNCDWVIGIPVYAMGAARDWLTAWRQLQVEALSSVIMDMGAAMDDGMMQEWQRRVDLPGQLPYEVANQFGNWRVDYAVVAKLRGQEGGWWCWLKGSFRPELVKAGLASCNAEAGLVGSAADGALENAGWCVKVSDQEIEIWTKRSDLSGRGLQHGSLQAQTTEGEALWLRIQGGGDWCAAAEGFAHIDVSWRVNERDAVATGYCKDERWAARVLEEWLEWREQRSCRDTERALGSLFTWRQVAEAPSGLGYTLKSALRWRELLRTIRAKREARMVIWEFDTRQVTIKDAVRMLSVGPRELIETW